MSNAFFKTFHRRKTKNLELAKAVLQAETNKQLKDYRILAEKYGMRIYKSVRKKIKIWDICGKKL